MACVGALHDNLMEQRINVWFVMDFCDITFGFRFKCRFCNEF